MGSPAPAYASWFVSVDGKSYGPYTEDQITSFIRQGRIGAQSPVMREGEAWANAEAYVQFAHLFTAAQGTPEAPQPTQPTAPVAQESPAAVSAPAQAVGAAVVASGEHAQEDELAKIIIIAELRTGSSVAFEAAVSRLGRTYRLNHYVWLVHTAWSLAQVRKEIAAHVGRNDPLFIADTTHGRAAWINFGPGAEATIKALWRGA